VQWHSLTAEPLAIGQESFTRVAFPHKRFVLIPELIPESMKVLVVGSMDIMTQFVQHRISDLLYRQELSFITGVA
jgi:hypothetical protein